MGAATQPAPQVRLSSQSGLNGAAIGRRGLYGNLHVGAARVLARSPPTLRDLRGPSSDADLEYFNWIGANNELFLFEGARKFTAHSSPPRPIQTICHYLEDDDLVMTLGA